MFNSASLRGIKGIKRTFLAKQDEVTVAPDGSIRAGCEKEQVLEADGINLKTAMHAGGGDLGQAHSGKLCRDIRHP